MAIQDRNTIRNWFLRGLKPTQTQFWDTWDSFWHKLDKISIDAIEGLGKILNNKAEVSQLEAHVNNTNNPHKITIEQIGGAQEALESKANKDHRHPIEEVSGLREELDGLMQIAAIRGLVETYAKLKELDKDNFVEGDSYIVEQDESRENVTTIYVLSNLEESLTWIFAGQWSTGAIYLPDLEDTSIMNLKTGQILKYNGVKWVNTDMVFSVIPDTSKIIVKSTIGEGFTLPAATTTTAGLMTVEDRVKLDSLNVKPIVQITAANYYELKDAVAKLNIIVGKGGFGEIVQTNTWTIIDDTLLDLNNIYIRNPTFKRINIDQFPLRITGHAVFDYLSIERTSIPSSDNVNAIVHEARRGYERLEIRSLQLVNITGSDLNSKIPIINCTSENAFSLRINNFSNFLTYNATFLERPGTLLCHIPKPTICRFTSDLNKSVNYRLDFKYKAPETNVAIDNSIIFSASDDINIILISKPFNLPGVQAGGVPCPSSGQKTKYHVLNALGEWIDIRALN